MLNFNYLKKNLKKDSSGFKKIKLAVVSDSASQLLVNAIKGYGIEIAIEFDIYEADYNQIDAQIFDNTSELYSFKPEYIFLNFSTEHLLKKFYKNSTNSKVVFAEDQLSYISSLCKTITPRLSSKIIVNNFIEINDGIFGNYANKINSSFIYQLRKLNFLLMDLCQEFKNLYVCDLNLLQSQVGYDFIFDPKMYVNADMVYSINFLPYIAKSITDIVSSIAGSFKKCLILDLDNTMWGGIIGDDGLEGIQIGDL